MTDFDDHETEQLLLLAQSGDPSAIQTLFQRYRPRLKRMVTYRMDRRLAVQIDSSDVVQDALTQAHVHFPEYLNERPVAFYPWLRQITWNRLQDLHRRHLDAKCRSVSREVSRSTELSDASAVLLARCFAASDTGPYQRLARQELREKIEQAISQLSEGI